MGSRKGSPNKFNKSMKDALELAFERSGGVDYLVRVAGDDPKTFCGLLGRLIPATVSLAVTHKIDLAAMMQLADDNSRRLNALNANDVKRKTNDVKRETMVGQNDLYKT